MTLQDDDELLHAPPAGSPDRWQENLFFICWDLETTTGIVCHLQRAPGLGLQEAQVAVAVGGRFASATLAGPFRADALVDEAAFDVVEPFRQWRLRLEAKGRAGAGPLGFLAVGPGGQTPFGVDLTLSSALPVADFAGPLAEVVAGMRADAHGPQMGDQQHYEQGGTWQGRLRVGDHEVAAGGLFVRDHSWGVRHEQGGFQAFWTASCLDGGRLFCNAIGVPQGDRVIGVGVAVDESGATFTKEVAAAFTPDAGLATYDRATITYGPPLGRTVACETQVHVPIYLPRSGQNRYDNNAISAVRMDDGRTGLGVIEWAAVLDDSDVRALEAEGAG